jgi:Helicase conserved C-terminal domain/Type III restriction enzyme, res subunit
MDKFIPWYPSIQEENFREILWNKREFFELGYKSDHYMDNEDNVLDKKYFLYPHQMFIERFMSPITPYDGLILFHNTGSGKTFSSIAVCEFHKYVKSKALVVVKGDTSYINFRDQIVKWYETIGNDLNEIKKNYDIKKYISFSNVIKKMSDQQIKAKFSNRIIVIDEVHNLKSLDFQEDGRNIKEHILLNDKVNHLIYNQMWRLLHIVENSKILLLTATPMIDKADEIYSIMNLLLDKNNQLSGALSLEKLEKAIRGRVSYLKSSEEMAEIEEQGELIPGCKIKVVPSMMRGIQLYTYRQVDTRDANDHVYRNSVYCSLMTLMDGSYGAKAFEKNIIKKKGLHGKSMFVFRDAQRKVLTRESLHLFSCKYAKTIEIIESFENELAFVFCEEVKGSGVIMFSCVLEAFGYSLYSGEDFSQIEKKPRYTIYTGDPSVCPNPEERLRGFRFKENKYGEYVKILIGSRVSGEGISLVNIRQVHIITPHWNISTVIQAIGRAVRRDSHHMLKKTERHIKIYRHVAIAGEDNIKNINEIYTPKVSIDMYKYKISEEKEALIKKVEEIMKNNAVDYYLNVNRKRIPQVPKDISSYLVVYSKDDSKHTALSGYPTFEYLKELFKNTPIVDIKNLGIEDELLSVMIDNSIGIFEGKKIALRGNKLCVGPEVSVHKKTTLEEFWKSILERETSFGRTVDNFEKEAIVYLSKCPRKELIDIVMSLDLDFRVRLVELSISERIPSLMSFFENSIVKFNGKWYHIMLYRAYEDQFSYSVSSEKFIISGKTRRFDFFNKRWEFAEDEEESVINTIVAKSKALRAPMEKWGIYGVVSTSDKKFRIRNIAFEDNEGASKDSRKINRGRYIDSYSLSDIRLIAMYLFSNQISYAYILEQTRENFPSMENTILFLENLELEFESSSNTEKSITDNEIFSVSIESTTNNLKKIPREKIIRILNSNKYDFRLFYWIVIKRKRELRNTVINALIDNEMYIVL